MMADRKHKIFTMSHGGVVHIFTGGGRTSRRMNRILTETNRKKAKIFTPQSPHYKRGEEEIPMGKDTDEGISWVRTEDGKAKKL